MVTGRLKNMEKFKPRRLLNMYAMYLIQYSYKIKTLLKIQNADLCPPPVWLVSGL
jgi:hypothetical protein